MGRGKAGYDLMRPEPGKVRCCICFELRDVEDLLTDADGVTWDLCAENIGVDEFAGSCARQAGYRDGVWSDRTLKGG